MDNAKNYCLKNFLSPETFNYNLFGNNFLPNSNFQMSNNNSPYYYPICLQICKFPSKPDSCSHKFCYQCIKKWMKFKKSCPYCRRTFKKINYII